MKAGLNGLRGKVISLISIVLMSVTIILWSWEKTPHLTAIFPPQEASLQLSSEIISSRSDEVAQHERILEADKNQGVQTLSSPTAVLSSRSDEEEKRERILETGKNQAVQTYSSSPASEVEIDGAEGEKTSKQEENRNDPVKISPQKSSSIGGGEDKIWKGFTVPHEIISSTSDEVAEHERILEADKSQGVQTFSSPTAVLSSSSDEKAKHERILETGKNQGVQTFSSPTTVLSSRSAEESRNERILETGKNQGVQTFSSSTPSEVEMDGADGEKTSKQKENRNDPVKISPQKSSSIGEDKIWNNVSESKDCNYAKGKWVQNDKRWPLYSGFQCKQWLSPMWACRLMQRTDFAYEKLRWQPKDCQMEEFEASKFFKRMQNKTLAFVGDSLGRQQFQSLMCMITGGKKVHDVEDVGSKYGLAITDPSARPSGWAFRFPRTNTTILYYWSASLCDIEPIDTNNPETEYAMHLDRPPAFLHQYLHKFDILVLNTGHHWNRGKLKANRWVMYIGGLPLTNKKLQVIWVAKNITIQSVVSWVNSQLPKYPGLKAFFRSISPRHFFGGEWNTGGSCDNTTPMSVGKEILDEESSDQSAASAVKGTGVKLLDITALSQLRDEGHISRFSITAQPGVQDCLHWCLPGVPDTWNELLFAQI